MMDKPPDIQDRPWEILVQKEVQGFRYYTSKLNLEVLLDESDKASELSFADPK